MPTPTLPATHPELGALTDGLCGRRVVDTGTGKRFFGTVFMAMGALFFLLVSLTAVVAGISGAAGGDPASGAATAAGLVCVGLAMAVVPVLIGFLLRRAGVGAEERDEEAGVYERGLLVKRDGEEWALPWERITHFYRPPAKGRLGALKVAVPYSFFRVQGDGGEDLELRGLPRLQDMGEAVEQATWPRRAAAALEALQAGGTAAFGDITATPRGLRGFGLGGMLVEWEKVEGFGIGKYNTFCIKERHNPILLKGPLFIHMPDVEAFLAVVERMRSAG